MAKRGSSTKYKDILKIGDALNERHSQYVEQYVHRAHSELYQLLAEIMRYAKTISEMKDSESAIATMRRQLKDLYQIKTTTKTGDLGVILRYVIRGAHRKTIFTYKRVLQTAFDNRISADNLTDYLETCGGIEKLIQSNSAAAAAKQQVHKKKHMTEFGRQLLNDFVSTPLATFQIDPVHSSRMHDAATGGSFRYMVCSYDGTYKVLDIVPMYGELEAEILMQLACDISNRQPYMSADELKRFQSVRCSYAAANNLRQIERADADSANDSTANVKMDAAQSANS